jgi:hypothetical protein
MACSQRQETRPRTLVTTRVGMRNMNNSCSNSSRRLLNWTGNRRFSRDAGAHRQKRLLRVPPSAATLTLASRRALPTLRRIRNSLSRSSCQTNTRHTLTLFRSPCLCARMRDQGRGEVVGGRGQARRPAVCVCVCVRVCVCDLKPPISVLRHRRQWIQIFLVCVCVCLCVCVCVCVCVGVCVYV